MICLQLTCSEDTNDFIESINGNPVNLSIEDWLSQNEGSYIDNGGEEYYPDLITDGINVGHEVVLTTSGTITAILAGGHPQRPR